MFFYCSPEAVFINPYLRKVLLKQTCFFTLHPHTGHELLIHCSSCRCTEMFNGVQWRYDINQLAGEQEHYNYQLIV